MVNIMDHENREVVERFPLNLVREPTAFTSNDPKVRILAPFFGVMGCPYKNKIQNRMVKKSSNLAITINKTQFKVKFWYFS